MERKPPSALPTGEGVPSQTHLKDVEISWESMMRNGTLPRSLCASPSGTYELQRKTPKIICGETGTHHLKETSCLYNCLGVRKDLGS